MNQITIQIFSPNKRYLKENIESIYLETNNDCFEIYPDHVEICANLSFGKIYLNFKTEQNIFNFFQASVNFNNQKNHVNIFCLEFNHEKEVLLTLKEMEDNLHLESETIFHLDFTRDKSIVLEKISNE